MGLAVFYTEYLFREIMHLPQTIENPFSIWIFIYTGLSSILVVLTIAGFLLWKFYEEKRHQDRCEEEYKKEIKERNRSFKESIKIPEIKEQLDDIILTVEKDPASANRKIRSLSAYLRDKLYSTPAKEIKRIPTIPERDNRIGGSPRSFAFLTQKRYHLWRHLLLLVLLAMISFALIFDYPDRPVFDSFHISFAVSFLLFAIFLIYLNLYAIFPLFLKNRKQRLYAYLLGGILGVLFIIITMTIYLKEGGINSHGIAMPEFLIPFGVAGNLLSWLLLLAGTSSISLLKKNMSGKWRLNRLEAERAEIEYKTLQQQINPHTLFNLLNNISIMSYDEPLEAALTLKSLEGFLDYILDDSTRSLTSVREEIKFIKDYLILERSSGRPLEIDVTYKEELLPIPIPPLLLIPFVENAIKHSSAVENRRHIHIRFGRENDYLIFLCENTIDNESNKERNSSEAGGLGIINTRRRLELLYGTNFYFEVTKKTNKFTITIKIPIS